MLLEGGKKCCRAGSENHFQGMCQLKNKMLQRGLGKNMRDGLAKFSAGKLIFVSMGLPQIIGGALHRDNTVH